MRTSILPLLALAVSVGLCIPARADSVMDSGSPASSGEYGPTSTPVGDEGLVLDESAWAEDGQGGALRCSVCSCDCTPAQVKYRKVTVPIIVTELRTKYVTEMKTEEKELPYTVFKRVPVTKKITQEKCYLADEIKTKVVTWKEPRLVQNPSTKTIHVRVPETELRTRTREVCRDVTFGDEAGTAAGGQEPCAMHGELACNTCGVGGSGPALVEEPYTCEVTVMRPDIRTEEGCVPDVVFETKSKVINYCVKTPKKEKVECSEETIYKLVPVEKTKKVQVCVPVKVPTAVEVQTCKLVTKLVPCCETCAHHR